MSDVVGAHNDLHSEQGAATRRAPGTLPQPGHQSGGPRLAGVRETRPDRRAETFARAFGFGVVHRSADELQLRGTDAGAPCVMVRRGARTRFGGMAFPAQDEVDVLRLADQTNAPTRALPESLGGMAVELIDPERHAGARSWPACTTCPNCPASPLTCSTSATTCLAPTPPSVRRGRPRRSSVSDTWCCSPPGTSRRWTGTSTTSG